MKTADRKPTERNSVLTSRGAAFAALVATGKSQTEAFKIAYNRPKLASKEARNRGYRAAQQPAVAARIKELTAKSEVKTLLSLNDRLAILAKHAQHTPKTSSDRQVSVRAIDVYSRIAEGETLNVKAEISGPEGGPVPIAAALTTLEKIAKFRAAREGRSS